MMSEDDLIFGCSLVGVCVRLCVKNRVCDSAGRRPIQVQTANS